MVLGVFHTVRSDGTEIYTTTLESCDCPASKECYHQPTGSVQPPTAGHQ